MSFRAAPTYVLERPLDNAIAGRELIAEAIAGRWGNPEATRFGNENERGRAHLERLPRAPGGGAPRRRHECAHRVRARGGAGALLLGSAHHARCRNRLGGARCHARRARARRDTARRAGRVPARAGLRVGRDRGELRPELRRLRRRRRGRGVPRGATEPRVPGSSTRRGSGRRDSATSRRSCCARLAIAHSLRADDERAARRSRSCARATPPTSSGRIDRCLAGSADVEFHRVTWESLYRALDPADPALAVAPRLPGEQEPRPPPCVRAPRRRRRPIHLAARRATTISSSTLGA